VVVVGGHAGLRWHPGCVTLVSLLYVRLVGHGLLGIQRHVWHVGTGHVGVLWHAGTAALRREMLVGRLVGAVDLVASLDVLVARSGLGRVKAGLNQVLSLCLGNKGL
jgi:hypothetical protein